MKTYVATITFTTPESDTDYKLAISHALTEMSDVFPEITIVEEKLEES